VEIDLHEPVEIGLADLFEGAAERDAGIVDQQVDAPCRSSTAAGRAATAARSATSSGAC
jgi:hypothetical protein